MKMNEAEQTIIERETTHGPYSDTSIIAQGLKRIVRNKSSSKIMPIQAESLDMICSKMARILSGNPDEPDHWKDIAGYALLVHDSLCGMGTASPTAGPVPFPKSPSA